MTISNTDDKLTAKSLPTDIATTTAPKPAAAGFSFQPKSTGLTSSSLSNTGGFSFGLDKSVKTVDSKPAVGGFAFPQTKSSQISLDSTKSSDASTTSTTGVSFKASFQTDSPVKPAVSVNTSGFSFSAQKDTTPTAGLGFTFTAKTETEASGAMKRGREGEPAVLAY